MGAENEKPAEKVLFRLIVRWSMNDYFTATKPPLAMTALPAGLRQKSMKAFTLPTGSPLV
jgi:hypothetical protein